MNTPSSSAAASRLKAATGRHTRAQRQATLAKAERDAMILAATQAGLTYREVSAATGLTSDRIAQVLREQRRPPERRTANA